MLRPGKMDKRVRIQKPVELQASSGELQTTFVPLMSVWAEVADLAGREYFNAQQMTVGITTRIRMRYRPELTEKMRILYTPRAAKPGIVNVYDVENVIHNEEGHRETVAMCIKSAVQGFKKEGAGA